VKDIAVTTEESRPGPIGSAGGENSVNNLVGNKEQIRGKVPNSVTVGAEEKKEGEMGGGEQRLR